MASKDALHTSGIHGSVPNWVIRVRTGGGLTEREAFKCQSYQ